jgi:hypothetical protein
MLVRYLCADSGASVEADAACPVHGVRDCVIGVSDGGKHLRRDGGTIPQQRSRFARLLRRPPKHARV